MRKKRYAWRPVVDVEVLERVRESWWRRVGPAWRRAWLALALAGLTLAGLLGRRGTVSARFAGVSLLLLIVLAGLRLAQLWARQAREPERVVRELLAPLDHPLSERVLRAIALVYACELGGASYGNPELARMHLRALLGRVSFEQLERRARRRRVGLFTAATLTFLTTAGVILLEPRALVEGLNVLVSQRGLAPLPMTWLELDSVSARPPVHIRGTEHALAFGIENAEPEGTWITVRGTPLAFGRELRLSDGTREVSFVSDGQGGVAAHYQLDRSAKLHILARFGAVSIQQSEPLDVKALPDRSPIVELEGAPRSYPLNDLLEVPLKWHARDDHGLRSVELVLESGGREERRSLVRLDGQTPDESGALALPLRDPFLRQTHLPVSVTIQARDDDSSGQKWGRSPALVLLPPDVGEAEAQRYALVDNALGKLTDWLAQELSELPSQEQRSLALAQLRLAAAASPLGLSLPREFARFLEAQQQRLSRLRASRRGLAALKEAVLAVDSAVALLSVQDAQKVSRRLAEITDEIESAARSSARTEQRERGRERVVLGLKALAAGGRQLAQLGALGADLGTIVAAGVARISVAHQSGNDARAARAAAFLSERLRRPNSSFSVAGGGGRGRASQGTRSAGGGSSAGAQLQRISAELQRIASEHQREIESVERAISDAEKRVSSAAVTEEAQQRARRLRSLVDSWPAAGFEPGSIRSSEALAREQSLSAADAMEHLELNRALDSVKGALSSLREASERGRSSRHPDDTPDPAIVEQGRGVLSEHAAWLERAIARLSVESSRSAARQLEGAAARERELSERTRLITERDQKGAGVLPDDLRDELERAARWMREAAGELGAERTANGLELQRKAQQLIERAGPESKSDEASESPDARSGPRSSLPRDTKGSGPSPSTGDAASAEAFRRRVQRGLGHELPGPLGEATRRYAEGLLR